MGEGKAEDEMAKQKEENEKPSEEESNHSLMSERDGTI